MKRRKKKSLNSHRDSNNSVTFFDDDNGNMKRKTITFIECKHTGFLYIAHSELTENEIEFGSELIYEHRIQMVKILIYMFYVNLRHVVG